MNATRTERLELDMDELESILERARREPLGEAEHRKLKAALETLGFLADELDSKKTSLKRLRGLLFGPQTEKLENILPEEGKEAAAKLAEEASRDDATEAKPRPKGHGRNGKEKYVGAEKIKVAHESLTPGGDCPKSDCAGRVYRQEPAVIVRVRGKAPLQATLFDLERLRCNLCGEVFTAKAPEGIGERKYDESAASMIALLKYGSGLPFNRLQRLQGHLGIPLPAATQWDIVEGAAGSILPAYEELIRQAAQGEVLHNDDTTARILALMGKRREEFLTREARSDERTGIFTSGIVSVAKRLKIALFFTGRKHAGENLEKVLAERGSQRAPPIQMSDALSRNFSGDLKTIVANCVVHARRQFVDVAENFPGECRHVLETFGEVYKIDAEAKDLELSPQERLELHRRESRPLMVKLRLWFRRELRERRIEPNSGLGKAIAYMKKHWRKLTLFYRKAGAPLDNNRAERALKKAILHRKAALFFKTENGARVADLFMSLIYTAELARVDPFAYLNELQRRSEELSKNPAAWMPWNYRRTLARLGSDPS